MAKKKAAKKVTRAAKRPKSPPGPNALAMAARRKTDRQRPGDRPGEDERIAVRRGDAMAARVQGATYRTIAEQNKCSVSTAYDDIVAELTAVCAKTRLDAELLRDLALERCDLVRRGFRSGVIKGDAPAGRVFLRAVELSAKLNGILQPANVQPGDDIPAADLSEREVAMRVAALVQFAENGIPGGVPGWKPKIH